MWVVCNVLSSPCVSVRTAGTPGTFPLSSSRRWPRRQRETVCAGRFSWSRPSRDTRTTQRTTWPPRYSADLVLLLLLLLLRVCPESVALCTVRAADGRGRWLGVHCPVSCWTYKYRDQACCWSCCCVTGVWWSKQASRCRPPPLPPPSLFALPRIPRFILDHATVLLLLFHRGVLHPAEDLWLSCGTLRRDTEQRCGIHLCNLSEGGVYQEDIGKGAVTAGFFFWGEVGWVVWNNWHDCESRKDSTRIREQMRGYKCLCYSYADAINIATLPCAREEGTAAKNTLAPRGTDWVCLCVHEITIIYQSTVGLRVRYLLSFTRPLPPSPTPLSPAEGGIALTGKCCWSVQSVCDGTSVVKFCK